MRKCRTHALVGLIGVAALLASCRKDDAPSDDLESLLRMSATGSGTVQIQSRATMDLASFALRESRAYDRILENLGANSGIVRSEAAMALARIYVDVPESKDKLLNSLTRLNSGQKNAIAEQWNRWAVKDQRQALLELAGAFNPPTRRMLIRSQKREPQMSDFGFGLRIGSSHSDVIATLGEPSWKDSPDSVGYCDNSEGCPDLVFKFENGRIVQAEW